MTWKKILRIIFAILASCLFMVVLLLAVGIAPINRTPDRDYLRSAMLRSLDTLNHSSALPVGFAVGYAKTNITPTYPTATAGYGKRMGKLFSSVRDSIFVRTLVVDNGVQRVAIVSADLLIIPPTVTAMLEEKLPDVGFSLNNTYLGAIHSHNSVGNWGKGLMTILYGSYDDSIVQFITDQIVASIQAASLNMAPATLKAGAIPLTQVVHNRLTKSGAVDSLLRVIEVQRNDSTKLLLMSSTAHATCMSSGDLRLSRDYPGELVDLMEAQGYSFAMFMAGAVGSHTGSAPAQGEPCIDWMAQEISQQFRAKSNSLTLVQDSTVIMQRLPLLLSDSQAKIFGSWRIRPWLFTWAFGDYPEFLTVLRLGNVVMLGTPCDFSGEFDQALDSLAAVNECQVMVTSFNGGYIGYVTPQKYYDYDHYETQLMNWYGPGNGEYIAEIMEHLLVAVMKKDNRNGGE